MAIPVAPTEMFQPRPVIDALLAVGITNRVVSVGASAETWYHFRRRRACGNSLLD